MVTETEWTRRYRHTGKCWWVCVKGDMKMFVYLQAVASQQSTLLAWRVANPVVRHMLSLVLKCITRRHFSCFLISLCPGISRVSLQVLCYESCIHWLIVRLPAAARLILERFFTWKCALHHLRLSRPWLSMEVSVLPDHMCTLSTLWCGSAKRYGCDEQVVSELRYITCHMGSHILPATWHKWMHTA